MELEPLLKEGTVRPYITVRGHVAFYSTLVTTGFQEVVMVENAERQHMVIIQNQNTAFFPFVRASPKRAGNYKGSIPEF